MCVCVCVCVLCARVLGRVFGMHEPQRLLPPRGMTRKFTDEHLERRGEALGAILAHLAAPQARRALTADRRAVDAFVTFLSPGLDDDTPPGFRLPFRTA